MIKAITFDFWYTLCKNRPINLDERIRFIKAALEAQSRATLETDQIRMAMDVARQTWDHAWLNEYRTIGAQEWLLIVLDELRLSLTSEDRQTIERQIEDTILGNPPILTAEIREVLHTLSGPYRLAIISDTGLTPGRVLHQILDQHQIARYFSHFTFSDQLGTSKPHLDNFLSTLKALEVEPCEAVHVGDLLRTDIAGAQQAGMRAVQYIGLNHDNTDPTIKPDAIIESHTQLEALLARWNSP